MDKTVPKPAAMLLDFIASKEAPKGYDTVYANRMDRMPKPLTSMTMKEVLDQGKWRTKTLTGRIHDNGWALKFASRQRFG